LDPGFDEYIEPWAIECNPFGVKTGAGIIQSARVSLKDGTGFNWVPFSLAVGPHRTMEVRFITDGEAAPRVVRLDEIASIT
jgi:hypothetical protein